MSEPAEPSTPREDGVPDVAAPGPEGAAPGKELSPAALRALSEAAERRALSVVADRAPERGGAQGPEPTRFGDWERKGVAVDF